MKPFANLKNYLENYLPAICKIIFEISWLCGKMLFWCEVLIRLDSQICYSDK